MPQIAVKLDLLDFQIRNRGQKLRVLIDQSLVLIDQAFLVEGDEHLQHGL